MSPASQGWVGAVALAAMALPGCAAARDGGVDPAIVNRELSGGGAAWSASVPKIAVDPGNPARVAVAWRFISMGDAGNQAGQRDLVCHLSLSDDGGEHFTDLVLDWENASDTPICNAPFVDIGAGGELLVGATLAGVLPQNAPEHTHPPGRVVMRLSRDWGKSWSPVHSAIATGDEARFAPNPAVPVASTHVPWDGARGLIDRVYGTITLSGGFPAPPGEELHSQRFYSQSHDEGKSWGTIHAFAAPGWPQRWDGHLISAHGRLAISYLADAVPDPGRKCLCVVFATGNADGTGFERHFVTETGDFDTLVHYPPIAAHPVREGSYALALVERGAGVPAVRVTSDGGADWRMLGSPAAPDGVVRASRPALAYAPGGELVVLWRGYYADGGYDTFVAAAREGEDFGTAVRLSAEPSRIPEALMADYSVRGDFIDVVAAGPDAVHAAWMDWRSGETGQVYYGRVALAALLPGSI